MVTETMLVLYTYLLVFVAARAALDSLGKRR